MCMSELVKSEFFAWADEALSQPISTDTVAFHFNLYEGTDSVHVQIMGTESFDDHGRYWPGDKTFSTGEDIFYVLFKDAGPEWPEWLESMKRLVSEYIESGSKSEVLRRSKGVGIGFVDGDMHVLWRPAA
jgi:hypothetical protein